MTMELTEEDASFLRTIARNYDHGFSNRIALDALANKITDMTTTKTRGPSATSFNSQVAELQPGESVSKVRAVDPTITVARLPAEMPAIRTQVRNSVAPAVARAKEQTGATYTTEVGDVVMPGGSMYVVAVITRLDD